MMDKWRHGETPRILFALGPSAIPRSALSDPLGGRYQILPRHCAIQDRLRPILDLLFIVSPMEIVAQQ